MEHFDLIPVSHVLILICYQANKGTGSGGKALLSLLGRNSYSEFRTPESEANLQQAWASAVQGMMLQYRGMREVSPDFATSFRDYGEVTSSVLIT